MAPVNMSGDIVDLGRQDKIVRAQAAEGVRGEFDFDFVVARQVQVGVVLFGFGDGGDAIEERHRSRKVAVFPGLDDLCAAIGKAPALKLPKLGLGLGSRELGDTTLTGLTRRLA